MRFWLFFGCLCFPVSFVPDASSELLRYRDGEGRFHYVDHDSKVPEQFRSSITDLKDVPGISRAGQAQYSGTPSSEPLRGPHPPASQTASAKSRRQTQTGRARVDVFVTDYCPYCRNLEAWLKDQKIPYNRLDIEKDPKAKIAFREIGGKGVPISRIGKSLIPGFDQNAILEALKSSK